MARYPLSVLDGKLSPAFASILALHVEPGAKILDPTCGQRYLWEEVDISQYSIEWSDIIEPWGVDLYTCWDKKPEWYEAFDLVVYDPPYMFGVPISNDPRSTQYGGYGYSLNELVSFMRLTETTIPWLLKPGGKIIVKCADQYYVPEHRFYPHHFKWYEYLTKRFEIIDFYVYRHHRMSPTAFQVKNRGSAVIVHTYFIVGRKQ